MEYLVLGFGWDNSIFSKRQIISCPPIPEVKVILEHRESASIRSSRADQEDGQSAKTTKFQHNTTSEEVTIHGGRKVQQRAIQGGIQGDISGGIQGDISGGIQGDI